MATLENLLDLETKFKELRKKHNLILPVVMPGEVSFSVEGDKSGSAVPKHKHTRKNCYLFLMEKR